MDGLLILLYPAFFKKASSPPQLASLSKANSPIVESENNLLQVLVNP